MKKIFLALLLFFFFPRGVLASSAVSVVETEVEGGGDVEVYQSVEATVNGKTVKKESSEPGELEVELEEDEEEAAGGNVVEDLPSEFSWEDEKPLPSFTPVFTPFPDNSDSSNFFQTLLNSIERFFGALVSNLTRLFE